MVVGNEERFCKKKPFTIEKNISYFLDSKRLIGLEMVLKEKELPKCRSK
jgi:hypothetical protein